MLGTATCRHPSQYRFWLDLLCNAGCARLIFCGLRTNAQCPTDVRSSKETLLCGNALASLRDWSQACSFGRIPTHHKASTESSRISSEPNLGSSHELVAWAWATTAAALSSCTSPRGANIHLADRSIQPPFCCFQYPRSNVVCMLTVKTFSVVDPPNTSFSCYSAGHIKSHHCFSLSRTMSISPSQC
jgi:hypothetical protein